jgi:hypothetical protein
MRVELMGGWLSASHGSLRDGESLWAVVKVGNATFARRVPPDAAWTWDQTVADPWASVRIRAEWPGGQAEGQFQPITLRDAGGIPRRHIPPSLEAWTAEMLRRYKEREAMKEAEARAAAAPQAAEQAARQRAAEESPWAPWARWTNHPPPVPGVAEPAPPPGAGWEAVITAAETAGVARLVAMTRWIQEGGVPPWEETA